MPGRFKGSSCQESRQTVADELCFCLVSSCGKKEGYRRGRQKSLVFKLLLICRGLSGI